MALDLEILTAQSSANVGESPFACLARVAEGTAADYVMLHSAAADAGASVIGFDPLCRVLVDAQGRAAMGMDAANPSMALPQGRPLAALEAAIAAVRFDSPHALVGWLGFVSYDVGRFLERVPAVAADDLQWPVVCFTLFRHYVVFEGGKVTAYDVLPRGQKVNSVWERLRQVPAGGAEIAPARILDQQSAAAFEAQVARVKEYVAAGDIYQANLAQRWLLETAAQPHDVFERLCALSPAPYAACIRFHDAHGKRHVVSASPELFLTVDAEGASRAAVTRPIKGTRPRDLHDAARDVALREELLASAKDQAELTMIVDLLRNDLGRVSEYGSVRVDAAREIERHPTVWHTVATIQSRLRAGAGLAEVLAALCPGGSITGAPKIRAMQIIEELEGFRRGMYCGNIGVIGPRGLTVGMSIAIRTMVMQAGRAYVYAGGGIVADSVPAREYEETLHKARAMLAALGYSL